MLVRKTFDIAHNPNKDSWTMYKCVPVICVEPFSSMFIDVLQTLPKLSREEEDVREEL